MNIGAIHKEGYNSSMNKEEIVYHLRGRWKEVEEIQRQELRAMTMEERWRQLNALARFAIQTGMKVERDESELEVILRWAKLKALYEVG